MVSKRIGGVVLDAFQQRLGETFSSPDCLRLHSSAKHAANSCALVKETSVEVGAATCLRTPLRSKTDDRIIRNIGGRGYL